MSYTGEFDESTVRLVQDSWSAIKAKVGVNGDLIVSSLIFEKAQVRLVQKQIREIVEISRALRHFAKWTRDVLKFHSSISVLSLKDSFFKDYPHTTKYFKRYGNDAQTILNNEGFQNHGRKNVFRTVDKIIGVLNDPEELHSIEVWIKNVHRPKKIADQDFQNLGLTLLKTIKQAMGEDWSEDVAEAWRTVTDALMMSFATSGSE